MQATQAKINDDLETIEIRLLLEGVFSHYGFDFRDYAFSSVKRRIWHRIRAEGLPNVSALQERVLHDRDTMGRLLLSLSVNSTAMFRDPGFYLAFREKVVPLLRTYPFVRIWHAGCSTGEEVYSMAILLTEEGLYDRCRIYATDMDDVVLEKARAGVFPMPSMQEYTSNYLQAGGKTSFSDYYTARYGNAKLSDALRKNVVFAEHNLATDGSFNEFNVVLCRNVMIYFNKSLGDRVHTLLYESLAMFGFLALGRKEMLRFSPHEAAYEEFDDRWRIYRKVR